MSNQYQPGDVVNGHYLGTDNQWHPVASGPVAQTATATAGKPSRNWFARHKIITGIGGGLLAIAVISSLAGGGNDDTSTTATSNLAGSSTSTTSTPTAAKSAAPTPTKAAAPAKPKMTKTQENALRSAQNYVSIMSMSKAGLIRQLSSKAGDGYSVADATWAAATVKADWKQEAVEAAENYQSIMPMSRSGLIRQLTSSAGDGFTKAEATHAADTIGL